MGDLGGRGQLRAGSGELLTQGADGRGAGGAGDGRDGDVDLVAGASQERHGSGGGRVAVGHGGLRARTEPVRVVDHPGHGDSAAGPDDERRDRRDDDEAEGEGRERRPTHGHGGGHQQAGDDSERDARHERRSEATTGRGPVAPPNGVVEVVADEGPRGLDVQEVVEAPDAGGRGGPPRVGGRDLGDRDDPGGADEADGKHDGGDEGARGRRVGSRLRGESSDGHERRHDGRDGEDGDGRSSEQTTHSGAEAHEQVADQAGPPWSMTSVASGLLPHWM